MVMYGGLRAIPFLAVRAWALLRNAALSKRALIPGLSGLSPRIPAVVKTGLEVIGVAGLVDFALEQFGVDLIDTTSLEDSIQELEDAAARGEIDLPGPRRDGVVVPPIAIVVPLSAGLNRGKPFGITHYYSSNFIKAVREREQEKGFKGTHGRKQVKTK